MKIIWSPLALGRVDEIAHYIYLDKPEAARKWVHNIFNKVEMLKKFPKSGRLVPETNRLDIREIIFKNYRIIYRLSANEISILTVRHGSQILQDQDLLKY